MEAILTPKVVAIETASEAFGSRLKPALDLLRSSLEKANTCEAASAESRTSDLRSKLSSHFGLVDDIQEALSDTDVLCDHISAVSEAAAALGWVISDDPPSHMAAIIEELGPFVSSLRSKSDPSHGLLADSVEQFITEVSDYVADNHKSPLPFIEDKSNSTSKIDSNDDHTASHLKDFRDTVTDAAVLGFQKASDVLSGSDSGHVLSFLAEQVVGAMNALYQFIVNASSLPEKPSDDDRQSMLSTIITHITAVNSKVVDVLPSDPFFNHAKAIEDSLGMLSWIVADEKPTSFITEAENASGFYLNKVLMTSKNTPKAAAHRAYVDSIKEIFKALRAYIKEHHSTGLRYGIGVSAPKSSSSRTNGVSHDGADEDDDESGGGNDYVSNFKVLVNGPLSDYVKASETLGGQLAAQAAVFAEAWKLEADFLGKAYKTPAPNQDGLQEMVMPIGQKMGEVSSVAESADPRGPLTQHLMAVSESIAALGWVAVDEKATAFVGDSAGTGQFYIDKVKMNARKTDNPEAHRKWAKALEALWTALKAYVKQFHTQKLVWNPPKIKKFMKKRSVAANDDDDADDVVTYVSAFSSVIASSVTAYVNASKALGGDVAKQAEIFMSCWKAEEEFLGKAFNMAKPDDVQSMLTPIGVKMGEVSSIAESANPRGPLTQHLMAVSESIAALGWVAVDEKATAFVGDSAGTGQFYIDKVKMGARKTDNPGSHREWAKCLETVWNDLKAYVKEYHTQKLVWNPPKVQKPKSRSRSLSVEDDDDSASSNYVSKFNELISGPLAAFQTACQSFGGDVAKQADVFTAAWKEEAVFIEKAYNSAKPSNEDDVQAMVMPIGQKMGEVSAIAEAADPRGPLTQHLMAVSESIAALGWVAVDEKATAFVGDSAGTGQFYIDKVKMGARKTDNPEAHREWAKALESLWNELKAYVKEYHTQKLVWNPPKAKKVSRKKATVVADDEDATDPSDYVSAFDAIISGPLAAYYEACKAIGGDSVKQADVFVSAWKAELEFLDKAYNMAKPEDFQDMLVPIGTKMGEVSALAESADPRGALTQHLMAVSESVAALGWVAVDERATGFVGDSASTGQFYIDKVKMGARKTDNPEAHREWAKALEGLWSALKAYVKEYHTQKLVWNPPKRQAKRSTAKASSSSAAVADDVALDSASAFKALIDGPLATYVSVCKTLGSDVAEQAQVFQTAWESELDLIKEARKIKKPTDDELQMLVMPIGTKMSVVSSLAEKADPRAPLTQHLLAVSESVSALGWVAVDERATAFVGDSAGTGQFYIDKVKMAAKRSNASDAETHRQWAQALETLWKELKAYVKEYHTQRLTWKK